MGGSTSVLDIWRVEAMGCGRLCEVAAVGAAGICPVRRSDARVGGVRLLGALERISLLVIYHLSALDRE